MDPNLFLIILTCILFSAFFSGMEIAFLSSNKLRIELENKQGHFNARILSFFTKRSARFIAALLVGNNIALVVYGIYMAVVLEPSIREYITLNNVGVLLIQTILSTILIVITGEFLPKAIFRLNPNAFLNFFAVPLWFIYWILWIPMMLMFLISQSMIRLTTGKKTSDSQISFGRIDLDNYLHEVTTSSKSPEEIEQEVQIFQKALGFSKVKARDCMIPRTDIIALDVNESIDSLKEKFIETSLSKILIYEDNIDHIIGYAHSYELFKKPEYIRAILLPISLIPETMPANIILQQFIKQSRSIAVVVDEFGGTSGMLTIEDVMEEIFGEIQDEHDSDELIEQHPDEQTYVFSARIEIDYLNEKYNLKIPVSDEYETLAGFILHHLADIPSKNDEFTIENFSFIIKEVSGTRIEIVQLILKQ
jgi:putative hemolysin